MNATTRWALRFPCNRKLRSLATAPLALLTLALLTIAVEAQAASPVISTLTPQGAQRGTDIELKIRGDRLDDAQEIMLYEPGIQVLELKAVDAKNVTAKLKVASDAVLGNHRLRVRTATGISGLMSFFVGALPDVAEVEPNTDFSKPQAITANVTLNGLITNEDVDYFVIEAKKGDRLTVEIEALRLGNTFFDPYVAIMNTARFELAASDDNALLWQDSVASIVVPEDGQYIIQVRDSAYGGNGESFYRVHVGNFPRPLAVFPAGGKFGETVAVKFLGDIAGEKADSVTLPSSPQQPFTLFAKDERGIAPSQSWFRVSEYGNVLEQEPNETDETATRFAAPLALNGVLATPGDNDCYRFTAKKGEVYDVHVRARAIRSPVDPVLTIRVAGKKNVGSNDDVRGPDSYLRFKAPADGDYVIEVRDQLGNGGAHFIYRVELTPVKPALEMTVAEFVRYVQPTVSIPRGSRSAVMLNVRRSDFGGPITIRGDNLPEGVTIETPGATANLNTIPVVFVAAAEAPVAGRLTEIIGRLDDPKQANLKVEGHLKQEVVMVRGRNQVSVWAEETSRLPVAVTDAVPFEISVVEPKVPLVRNGTMELKVVAKRQEGFKAAIKIDMLWLPPGINAAGSISIAEGKTEAVIPMNASGNAEVNTWQIAVRGQANTGKGDVMICTPFVKLRTAEMYVDLKFEAATVEQGQDTELLVHVERNVEFPGTAKVELFGLPNKCTTEPLEITKDTKDLVFKIKTDAKSPAGKHKNLFCRVIVTEHDEPIVHNIGNGELRIDVPLPPRKDAPKAPVAKKPAAAAPKRLSRLEQLRLEQAEREKAKTAEEK